MQRLQLVWQKPSEPVLAFPAWIFGAQQVPVATCTQHTHDYVKFRPVSS